MKSLLKTLLTFALIVSLFSCEEDDGVSFEHKMKTITTKLSELFNDSKDLENLIKDQLKSIGYDL